MENKLNLHFKVNGKKYSLSVLPLMRLIDILREELKLTGTKEGCGAGECGACYVELDGELANSCLVPAIQLQGTEILTIEGIKNTKLFKALEKSFEENGGTQCGFCTPGIMMASYDLLKRNPKPSKQEILNSLSGSLCRCTGYSKITESIIKSIKRAGS